MLNLGQRNDRFQKRCYFYSHTLPASKGVSIQYALRPTLSIALTCSSCSAELRYEYGLQGRPRCTEKSNVYRSNFFLFPIENRIPRSSVQFDSPIYLLAVHQTRVAFCASLVRLVVSVHNIIASTWRSLVISIVVRSVIVARPKE
jgi:hypothetical protein